MKAKIDTRAFTLKMNNLVKYAEGFVEGAELGKKDLLANIAPKIKEILEQYIDSHARTNPESLHHVYEWYQTGSPSGRLFDIEYIVSGLGLSFQSTMRQSQSIKNGSYEPFYNKANIMEKGVPVVIKPKNRKVLRFEVDGEEVFTKNPVTVTNPGGSAVQGAYEDLFKEFFTRYLSQSFLDITGLRSQLGTPMAFANNLASGLSGGKPVGLRVGKNWIAGRSVA